jgi:hypothetical protein
MTGKIDLPRDTTAYYDPAVELLQAMQEFIDKVTVIYQQHPSHEVDEVIGRVFYHVILGLQKEATRDE